MLDAKDAFTPKKRFDTTSNVRKTSNIRIYNILLLSGFTKFEDILDLKIFILGGYLFNSSHYHFSSIFIFSCPRQIFFWMLWLARVGFCLK